MSVVITGTGAVCAAGADPADILGRVMSGETALHAIEQWDTSTWPTHLGGEIPNFNARAMVDDRKLHKLIRRTDLVGLYAAGRAIGDSGIVAHRDALPEGEAATYSDRSGVIVGSGGGNFANQYDYFPLMTVAGGDMRAFGR
jgi:3-oxoacyl-(acyl-carrier-protein) synthase